MSGPVRADLRGLGRETVAALRRHDLLLFGAGVTFYGAVSLIPGLLVSVWLAARLVGEQRVRSLASELSGALPATLGAPEVAESFVLRGLHLTPLTALVAALPASLYGEGLRRAYTALAGVDEPMVGWRGRLTTLPLLAAAPVLLLAVLTMTPLLNDLLGAGTGPTLLGVYLSLNVMWLALSLPLAWTYRVVAPDPPPWRVAVVGGFFTGAFVSGFLQGFVLFLWLPINLATPFGGSVATGAVVAVLLWLWLLHLVVLVGYVATRRLAARGASPGLGRW